MNELPVGTVLRSKLAVPGKNSDLTITDVRSGVEIMGVLQPALYQVSWGFDPTCTQWMHDIIVRECYEVVGEVKP